MTDKLKLRLDDPETLKVWEAIKRAKREVEEWPAWKRGEMPLTPDKGSTP